MDNIDIYQYSPARSRIARDVVKRSQVIGKRTYSPKTGRLRVKTFTSTKARVYACPRVSKHGSELEVWLNPEPWSSNYYPYFSKVDYDSLKAEVSAKWYSEVANTNALLPLMFKERQQTIDLVTKKILYFAKLRKNFHREFMKLFKGDKKARHEIMESKWLEYRYGWLPTLADIDTLINQPLGLPSARVAAKQFRAFSYENDGGVSGKVVANGNFHMSYGAYVYPKGPNMQVATQYGIANPLLVAWEMVPFSFAVDWFLDIGGYLESLGALNGLEIDDYWHTYGGTLHKVFSIPAIPGSYSNGFCYSSQVNATRVKEKPVYPNPLVPSNGLNLFRLFDAIALCDTIFTSSRK